MVDGGRVSVSPAALGHVMEAFERNFRERGEIGASVSVWWNGSEVLHLADGWMEGDRRRRWTDGTLVPVYSATKPAAAATLLHAMEQRGLAPDTPVREIWPAFPVEAAAVADLLAHRCGLPALDRRASVWDHAEVVAALEAQEPAWRLGEGHGYHPRTFGFLLDELVRRLTGRRLGEFWRDEIAGPLDLEFWIGLPEDHWPRVARLHPGRATKSDWGSPFYRAFQTPGSLTQRAFGSPRGLQSVAEMNDPRAWAAGFPAMGGVASARGLARFYQVLLGTEASPVGPVTRHALAARRVDGDDRVLCKRTSFSCGCQLDPLDGSGAKLRWNFGLQAAAFGHPGAGGSHAFGDPTSGVSFAYVMNQMELSVLPGPKTLDLVSALEV